MSKAQRICFIVAVSRNHVIGRSNELPWKLRCDLQRFKRLTMGHAMLMGRKTFESLPKVLPGRKSIILTRDPDYQVDHPDVTVVRSMEEATQLLLPTDRLYVIGGAEVFHQYLSIATDVLLTRVYADVEGDIVLPPFDFTGWNCIEQEYVPADDKNDYPSQFEHWVVN